MGISVRLLDVWGSRDEILNSDLFHLFGSNHGMYDLAGYLNEQGVPFVVSPIYFTRRSAGTVRKAVTLTKKRVKKERSKTKQCHLNDKCNHEFGNLYVLLQYWR